MDPNVLANLHPYHSLCRAARVWWISNRQQQLQKEGICPLHRFGSCNCFEKLLKDLQTEMSKKTTKTAAKGAQKPYPVVASSEQDELAGALDRDNYSGPTERKRVRQAETEEDDTPLLAGRKTRSTSSSPQTSKAAKRSGQAGPSSELAGAAVRNLQKDAEFS